MNPQFVNQYEAGDTRKKASVIDIVNEGIVNADGFEASFKDQREYTGYVIKKYSPLCFADGTSAVKIDGSGGFQEQNHQDWVIMRYAVVLLMAAVFSLLCGSTVVYGLEEFDSSAECTLNVLVLDSLHDDKPIADADVTMYYVADVRIEDGKARYVCADEFAGYAKELEGVDSEKYAAELYGYVKEKNLTGTTKF